jgi:hypothetical protein
LNLGNQRLPSGTEFESAIYQGEQCQLVPKMDPRDPVRTCPDLGNLLRTHSYLACIQNQPIYFSARYTPGGSTRKEVLRSRPRPRLAFCTLYRPLIGVLPCKYQELTQRNWRVAVILHPDSTRSEASQSPRSLPTSCPYLRRSTPVRPAERLPRLGYWRYVEELPELAESLASTEKALRDCLGSLPAGR